MELTPLTLPYFDRLYRLYGPKLTSIAFGFVRDEETARDIVNDSYVALWERRGEIDTSNNVEAYLFRIVRNNYLRFRRDEHIKRRVYENILRKERGVMEHYTRTIEACDPDELFRSEIVEICRVELDRMPELTRRIFRYRKVEGKSHMEIASALNVNTKKVDNELRKAVAKLRCSLKDYLALAALILLSK
jgi:RNA polymerase sigma-70 factor (ECF subfamily)